MPVSNLPPLSLYVHLPWCIKKCPYCDFNSHTLNPSQEQSLNSASKFKNLQLEPALEKAYVAALLADLDADLAAFPDCAQRPVQSVFFGGGTPSLMSPAGYAEFFAGLNSRMQLAPNAEITLEANPGTCLGAEPEARFAGYLAAGINRLSLGVQSFHGPQLQALGRIHSGADAQLAVQAAKAAGFKNFNLDLMHGLPQQTSQLALEDLELALSLEPTHLSWYQLTLEPNTVFYRQPPQLPVIDELESIQEGGENLLQQAGWQHYETSAFARPNHQAQHNLNYWQFGDYLGVGAGAHGKLSQYNNQGELEILRRWKTRQPQTYLDKAQDLIHSQSLQTKPIQSVVAGNQQLDDQELIVEFMLNALRLAEGVPVNIFEERTGLTAAVLTETLAGLAQKNLWTSNPKRLACSPLGWRWLNTVIQEFMQD